MLIPNWREVLKRAWSVRLMLLATLLSGLEAALPFMTWLPIPEGVFALASFFIVAGAFAARFIAQGIGDA